MKEAAMPDKPLPRLIAGLAIALLACNGCSVIKPAGAPFPAQYSLDYPAQPAAGMTTTGTAAARPLIEPPTLIVSPPHATAGFDTSRMAYVREPYKLEYFAQNRWIDPPARMLAPLIVASLAPGNTFHAVVTTPSSASGDFRLDTEIIRLQHEFTAQPSRVRFTLRAYLINDKTRAVLASREFEAVVTAETADPRGGAVAANGAVQKVLADLSAFCQEVARATWIARQGNADQGRTAP